jgi:hypothetical protein
MPQDFPSLEVPNAAPQGLQKLSFLQTPPTRPLDPNGVDVVKEIPMMQKAYAASQYGRGLGGKQEAGYTLQGTPGHYNRSQIYVAPSPQATGIPTNSSSLATVHTHPINAQPTPSDVDTKTRLPGYVYSGNQLYVTDPKTHSYSKYDIDKWNLTGLNKLR